MKEDVPRRPIYVTIALVLLWILVATWALGALAQVTALEGAITPATWSYIAYLVALAILPAVLIVKIGQARSWSRTALMVLYGLDILFRIYLLDFGSSMDVVVGILAPATLQSIAFVLLFLPPSNAWFRGRH